MKTFLIKEDYNLIIERFSDLLLTKKFLEILGKYFQFSLKSSAFDFKVHWLWTIITDYVHVVANIHIDY